MEKINFYFRQNNNLNGSLDLDEFVNITSNLQNSYRNYLEINLVKKGIENTKAKTFLKDKDKLIISDLKHGSLDITLSPIKVQNTSGDLFENKFGLDNFIKESLNSFEEEVISFDYNNPYNLENIKQKYTDEERRQIYAPFSRLFENPNLESFIRRDGKNKKLIPLTKNIGYLLFSKENTKATKNENSHYGVAFVEFGQHGKINKKNIKKVFSLKQGFDTDIIKFNNQVFLLNMKLNFTYKVENSTYIVDNDYLDFSAWGSNEEEAKEAIYFSFYALYQNYYLENDDNLTKKAQELKVKLKNLINRVILLESII